VSYLTGLASFAAWGRLASPTPPFTGMSGAGPRINYQPQILRV